MLSMSHEQSQYLQSLWDSSTWIYGEDLLGVPGIKKLDQSEIFCSSPSRFLLEKTIGGMSKINWAIFHQRQNNQVIGNNRHLYWGNFATNPEWLFKKAHYKRDFGHNTLLYQTFYNFVQYIHVHACYVIYSIYM